MHVRKFVESLSLVNGQKHRGNCPECGGYNTFSAEKDGGAVKYFCFKAGCPVSGIVKTGFSIDELKAMPRHGVPNDGRGASVGKDMPDMHLMEHRRFEVHRGVHFSNCFWYYKDNRFLFPCYNSFKPNHPAGIEGYIGLSYKERPKWVKYGKCVGYFNAPDEELGTWIIVEDAISAQRVSNDRRANGYALLGTNVTASHMAQLKQLGAKKLVVALDPDAVHKTQEAHRTLSAVFPTKPMLISKDLKDLTYEGFNEFIMDATYNAD